MNTQAGSPVSKEAQRWANEVIQMINKLSPEVEGQAFDPGWFLLRQKLESFPREAQPPSGQSEAKGEAVETLSHEINAAYDLHLGPTALEWLQGRIRKAFSEAKGLEADALRYRFLRDVSDADLQQPYICQEQQNSWGKWFSTPLTAEEADKLIDDLRLKSNALTNR